MDCSMPGHPVHHQFQELTKTHVHWVDDAIQPSQPLSSPSPAFSLPMSQLFASGCQSTGISASASVLPINTQCGERAPPMANVMRKEAWHTQRWDQASGVSLEILEHLPPKPESAYFMLCAFTYTSDFMGGCPPLPLSEKRVSLQLQLIIPGCDSV